MSSGVWIADIADHLPVYTFLPRLKREYSAKCKPEFIYKRFYSEENMNNFRSALTEIDWNPVHIAIGVNNKYECFNNILQTHLNQHFPEKKIKINVKSEAKPWITPSILNSVKKKNLLYKNCLKFKSDMMLDKYKNTKIS